MQEEVIFTECAPEFVDGEIPSQYQELSKHYDIRVFILNPSDFGDPVDRLRMWAVMAKKDVVQFTSNLTLPTLLGMFGRKVVMNPDMMFVAPVSAVEAMHEKLVIEQCAGPDIPTADFRSVLDGSRRGRLDAYESKVAVLKSQQKIHDDDAVYFDLDTNLARSRFSVNKLMTSCTHFSLWVAQKQRLAHHFEMLETNGVLVAS